MSHLLEHVKIDTLSDDIKAAISYIDGDPSVIESPFDIPDYIREHLNAGPVTVLKDFRAGPGITKERSENDYDIISSNSSGHLTDSIVTPTIHLSADNTIQEALVAIADAGPLSASAEDIDDVIDNTNKEIAL